MAGLEPKPEDVSARTLMGALEIAFREAQLVDDPYRSSVLVKYIETAIEHSGRLLRPS